MSEHVHWKTRTLLAYATIYGLGHLLWLTVLALYLAIWLLASFEGGGGQWAAAIFGGVLFCTITAANCVALYFLLDQTKLTRKKLRFITIFTASMVGIYSLVAVFASEPALAWCAGVAGILLLPVPIRFSRPALMGAIQALPVDEDLDLDNWTA